MMKKSMALASAAMISIALLSGGAGAQGTPQTVELVKVDVQKLAAGYRSSKVVGSSVVNDANETIGKIDDLLVSRDGKQPYAVLSIGGFLGMGTRLVVVPYDTLKFADKKVILPGGTKEGLKMLPEFKYATELIPTGAAEGRSSRGRRMSNGVSMMSDTSSDNVRNLEARVRDNRRARSGARLHRAAAGYAQKIG